MPGVPGGAPTHREGPEGQGSHDPGLSEPADPKSGENSVPLCGELLSAKADGPFHRHLPTPVPGWVLGFRGEAKASVGRRGDTRGAALFTQQRWAPAPTGSCVCAQVAGEGALLCSHGATSHLPSPPSPFPSPFSLSLFPPSFFQQTAGCPSWYPTTGGVPGAQGLCGSPSGFS